MSSTNGAGSSRSVSIEQVEALLRSLAGVAGARIGTGPEGEVEWIEIQTDGKTPPHQLARDVQSALLASFGLLIEVGAIRFVGIEERPAPTQGQGVPRRQETPRSPDTPEAEPTRPATRATATHDAARAGPDRHEQHPAALTLVDQPTVERLLQNRIRCRVELSCNGKTATGEAELLAGDDAAYIGTARAVLAALRGLDPQYAAAIDLEGAREVPLAGRRYVMVGIRTVKLRSVQYLAGAAPISEFVAEAAAVATLQAVRQWTAGWTPAAGANLAPNR